MIPTGTLHDDGRTLVLRRTFTAGIEEVWASVTESERPVSGRRGAGRPPE